MYSSRIPTMRRIQLSIAMCTYNGALYLREQLDSIAAQTRLPDELVVCDDGSTDRTLEVLDGFAAAAPFAVRVHVNRTKLGTPKNFERAIELTRGEIIALGDQDDVWYPHKLQRLEQELARSEQIGLVFSDADVVDHQLRPVGYRLSEAWRAVQRNRRLLARGRMFEALIRDNVVTGCTVAFRARYKDLIIPVPTACAHDSWMALVIAAVAEIARVDDPLLAYRQHATNQNGLARYHGEGNGAGPHGRKTTAEKLYRAEGRLARLRAAYRRLDESRHRFPAGQVHLRLLRGAIRHGARRIAILRETNLARRVLMASRELAGLRYARYSEGFRRWRKDVTLPT